jgi:hypothetical protein
MRERHSKSAIVLFQVGNLYHLLSGAPNNDSVASTAGPELQPCGYEGGAIALNGVCIIIRQLAIVQMPCVGRDVLTKYMRDSIKNCHRQVTILWSRIILMDV